MGSAARHAFTFLGIFQVHIASVVHEITLLGVLLVIFNIMARVVVELISHSVNLPRESIIQLLVRINTPHLLEFLSEFEVDLEGHLGVTSGLMHGSDSVNAELLGNASETASEIDFLLDLFAIVVVSEVEIQFGPEFILVRWQLVAREFLVKIPEVHSSMECDPVVPSFQYEAAIQNVGGEEVVRDTFVLVLLEAET